METGSARLMCVAVALLLGAGGCSTSDATGSDAGSGGTTGSGGAAGTGGATGSGGTTGIGGATGSGGAAGTGGATGSGGAGLDAATDRGGRPSDAGVAPTFTEIFSTILTSAQSCANGYCHGAGRGGVYLTSKEMAYATLVPAKVIANNPNGSILIQRLTTTNTDQRMPKGESPLSGAEIEKVRAWILAGAPNN
jgi:two-component system chemotaxis sensor kinase CheA